MMQFSNRSGGIGAWVSQCALVGAFLLVASHAAQAQLLQNYLPDVAPPIGQLGSAIAPDVTATPRGTPEIQPADTVTTRPHPEYDTLGVHVGDFYIRPTLDESAGYNSNLFADTSNRGAAMIDTTGGVAFASDWSRNAVQGSVLVDNTIYPTQSAQSFTNVTVDLGGTYQIGRTQLQLQYSHASTHIARGSIDVESFDKPIPFQIDRVHIGYMIPFSRLSFEPALDILNYRFNNGTFNGAPVIETINNRYVFQPSLTTRYELAPLRSLVFVVSGAVQNFYDFQEQNSKSIEFLGGIDFNLNALVRVRALAGYEVRTFTNSAFSNRSAPVIDANVIWTPTELTTVTLGVNRSIEDTLSTVTNGYTYTSAKLSVDHELFRNVLLNIYTQDEIAEFTANQGTTNVYSVGGMATWQLNREVSLKGRFNFADRQATGAQGASYSQNLLLFGIGLRL